MSEVTGCQKTQVSDCTGSTVYIKMSAIFPCTFSFYQLMSHVEFIYWAKTKTLLRTYSYLQENNDDDDDFNKIDSKYHTGNMYSSH